MNFAILLWLTFLGLVAFCGAKDAYLGEILIAIERAVASDCSTCLDLLVPAQKLARLGDHAFVETFTTICKILELDEDDDVCEGIMGELAPIVALSLRSFHIQSETAPKFCIAAFGLCPHQPVRPYKVPFPKPKPTHPKQIKSTGKPPFQVVHISDVHIDRKYTVGAEANCTKNICCRHFADQTGPIQVPAGPFGNHKCDSPPDLADSMLRALGEFSPKAHFAIFTGDVAAGDTWIIDRSEVSSDLEAWNHQLGATLKMPVYAALGNHDMSPVNSFVPDDAKTNQNSQWVYDIQAAGWARWINPTAANEVRHHSGCYAEQVPGTKLTIISINTQYWYKQNFYLYNSDHLAYDSNGILAFLVSQLQAAEDAGRKVWMIMHIPMGKEDTLRDPSNYVDQILQRYSNTIAGIFAGHSHKIQFEIGYSDWKHQNAQTARSVALIGPALTPTSGLPAVQLYDVDPDTYEVMDAKVYLTNVSDPHFQTKPRWQLYYSTRESYGPLVGLPHKDPLNATFWHQLTEVFEANHTAFDLWNTRLSRGAAVSACTGDCITTSICDQRALRSENNCDNNSRSINFKRDITGPSQEHEDCEGPSFGSIFKKALSGAHAGEPGAGADMKRRIRRALEDL